MSLIVMQVLQQSDKSKAFYFSYKFIKYFAYGLHTVAFKSYTKIYFQPTPFRQLPFFSQSRSLASKDHAYHKGQG